MSRFSIKDIEENGKIRYCIHDNMTGNDIHCEKMEINRDYFGIVREIGCEK